MVNRFYYYNQGPIDSDTFYGVLSSHIKNFNIEKVEKFLKKHNSEGFFTFDIPYKLQQQDKHFTHKNPGYILGLYAINPFEKDAPFLEESHQYFFEKINKVAYLAGLIRAAQTKDYNNIELFDILTKDSNFILTSTDICQFKYLLKNLEDSNKKDSILDLLVKYFIRGNPDENLTLIVFNELFDSFAEEKMKEFFKDNKTKKTLDEVQDEPQKVITPTEEFKLFNIFWNSIAKNKYEQALKIAKKIDINKKTDYYGEHYLHSFIFKNPDNIENREKLNNILKFFTENPEHKFNPNIKNKLGETFLHKTLNHMCYRPYFFEILIKYLSEQPDFNINEKNDFGHNALRVFLDNYGNSKKSSKYSQGASSLKHQNNTGLEFPIDKILELFWDHKADFDAKPSESKRGFSSLDVIKKLSKANPEIQIFYEKIFFNDVFAVKKTSKKVKI